MDKALRQKTTWSGSHKGIGFEIARWNYNDSLTEGRENIKEGWNSYIILAIEMFPEECHKDLWLEPDVSKYGSVYYSYSNDTISAIDFHCGCTYYDKMHGLDGGRKVIKVGCDYNHLHDEGMIYDVEYVHMEIKRAIESLIISQPNLKHRCVWNGKYYDVGDGYILRDDTFYSFEGMTQKAGW
jgi:hypothetical protein